ncbi:MAG: NAD(P)/FAD-dependent oxidoreductase [Kofleriaceae bacterium]
MARTPIFRALRRVLATAHRRGRAAPGPADVSRREFLGATAAVAALVPLASACGGDDEARPLIAIVGGGIAGLHCAHRLAEAGVTATVYEASARAGGRMSTARGLLADGQLVELGGELIDTGHATMMALAAEFSLALDDLAVLDADVAADTFHFDGAVVSAEALVTAFTPVAALMASTVTAAEADDAEFERVDALSIPAWLEQEAGLAPTALIRRVLELAYEEEYGLPAAQQSVFNLLYLIDYDDADPFRIFGDSDERFHVHAGNDAITNALAQVLGDQVVLDHALIRVARDGARYALTFETPAGEVDVVADHVVFALPFSVLREVDLDDAGLSDAKREVIAELGYGTNAKLMLQFASRPWRDPGGTSGGCITDVGALQTTWETSRGQGGDHGVLTNFVGGERGVALGDGTAEERAAEVLPWIDTVFPGTAATYVAGSAVRQHWPTQPFTKGSYACYRVGQWAYWGTEGQREGNLHFCGEHTSLDFQGYMEGGAETGALVAAEILDDVGLAPSSRHAALLDHKLRLPQACYHGGGGAPMPRRSARRRALRALARR